jgi:hypothetical protein
VAAFVSSRSKNDLLVWIFVAVATPSSNVEWKRCDLFLLVHRVQWKRCVDLAIDLPKEHFRFFRETITITTIVHWTMVQLFHRFNSKIWARKFEHVFWLSPKSQELIYKITHILLGFLRNKHTYVEDFSLGFCKAPELVA